MIAFGVCIGNEEKYSRYLAPSLTRLLEPDSLVLTSRNSPSIFVAYNEMLDVARANPALEALVLIHEDVELRDENLFAKLRAGFSNETTGVIGVIGAIGVTDLAWWQADGRGRCQETRGLIDFGGGSSSVEVVDGLFMALSPRAVAHVRFDQDRFHGFHGYDADICFSVRQAGMDVVTADIDLFHHTKGGFGDATSWNDSNSAFCDKWSIATTPGSWPTAHRTAALSTLPPAADPLIRIDLGGGRIPRRGWINLDPVHGEGRWRRKAQDVPWPVNEGTVEAVYASHMMEHVPAGGERIAVMNEAWRVLRPLGTFEIRVPLFPRWEAIADPTHLSYWVPESFLYFTGQLAADADYGINRWELVSSEVVDNWELRGILRKPS